MTARHQGAASAAIAAHWLRQQPTAFLGFRDATGDLVGYMANLRLEAVTAEDCAADPALNPALEFMRVRGPARAGEQVSYQRFWMGRDDHQSGRATMNVVAANASAYWTSHPTLAWNFVAVADPEHFAPMFTSIHIWRSPEADFEVGGRRYGVFAHDWRTEPIAQWLQAKVERASQYDATAAAVPAAPPLLVLSQAGFADAVRQALRDYARGDALDRNPLLRARLLQADAAAPARADALRALLREAAGTLEGTDRKLHDAIWHTYLQPAATQEQAAELLDLPFNTYRYRLARGTERITEWLWRHEIEGPDAAATFQPFRHRFVWCRLAPLPTLNRPPALHAARGFTAVKELADESASCHWLTQRTCCAPFAAACGGAPLDLGSGDRAGRVLRRARSAAILRFQ